MNAVSLQIGIGPDDYCKVPYRIHALTAGQAEAFAKDIEHGHNVTMCAQACVGPAAGMRPPCIMLEAPT